jgi:hypothetical protein
VVLGLIDELLHKGMNAVRGLAVLVTRCILGILFVLVAILEFGNLKGSTEVIPVASFVVFLSLASFSISWARVNPPISTLAELKRVKRAGLDFFIATGLALSSAGLLRLGQDALLGKSAFSMLLLVLHGLMLAAALFIGWLAFSALLRQSIFPSSDAQSEITA